MLATCPHCRTEAEFLGFGDPGSTRALKQMMFGAMQPLAKMVDEHVASLQNRHVLECSDCRQLSNRCASCDTLFVGAESETRCPDCHSNQAANG